ncbi:MAG: hypothetical protein JO144_16835, partial [Actinobacteria bacterium]|nr:hypothetical protein [Actinomycetota bacterium]
TLQAALLVRAATDPGSTAVAEAFLASRLGTPREFGGHAGAGLGRAGCAAVLEYSDPNWAA